MLASQAKDLERAVDDALGRVEVTKNEFNPLCYDLKVRRVKCSRRCFLLVRAHWGRRDSRGMPFGTKLQQASVGWRPPRQPLNLLNGPLEYIYIYEHATWPAPTPAGP